MRYLALAAICLAVSAAQATSQPNFPCGGFLAGNEYDGGGSAGQTYFQQLQQWSGWGSCDNNLCSGGLGTGNGTCWIERYQRYPSLTGASAEIYDYYAELVNGQEMGDNALFFKKLAPAMTNDTLYNGITSATFYYSMKVDSSAVNNAQALEFDVFQFYCQPNGQGGCTAVYRFMMGTQCDLHPKNYNGIIWEFWDPLGSNGPWDHSYNEGNPIDCSTLLDGNWHKIILNATMNLSSPQTYTFKTLKVDTSEYTITGATYDTPTSGDDPNIGIQFQIDVTSAGNGYHEWFDDVRLCTLTSGCPTQ